MNPRDDDLYEIVEDSPSPASAKVGADAGGRVLRAAPIAYATPAANPYFPDRAKDLYTPLILIGGGLAVRTAHVLWFHSADFKAIFKALGVQMVGGTIVMLVAILIAGKLRNIDFGPLPVAIMKLCAVMVAPPAVGILLAPMFFLLPIVGGFAVPIIEFCTAFALLGALFDLDQSDTWYCICIMFILYVAMALTILWVF